MSSDVNHLNQVGSRMSDERLKIWRQFTHADAILYNFSINHHNLVFTNRNKYNAQKKIGKNQNNENKKIGICIYTKSLNLHAQHTVL